MYTRIHYLHSMNKCEELMLSETVSDRATFSVLEMTHIIAGLRRTRGIKYFEL